MMWYRPQAFVLGGSGKAQLRVRGLSAGYGPFEVIRQLNFDVLPGLTVILGPNGAGKPLYCEHCLDKFQCVARCC